MPTERHLRILIESIPHDTQRYNTCGDWRVLGDGTLLILVSESKNLNCDGRMIPCWKTEALVGLHEAIEALACRAKGIDESQVDAFDMDPSTNETCETLGIEPGDHPKAPYKKQHGFATGIERLLAHVLEVPWYEYEEMLNKMTETYDEHRTRTT